MGQQRTTAASLTLSLSLPLSPSPPPSPSLPSSDLPLSLPLSGTLELPTLQPPASLILLLNSKRNAIWYQSVLA